MSLNWSKKWPYLSEGVMVLLVPPLFKIGLNILMIWQYWPHLSEKLVALALTCLTKWPCCPHLSEEQVRL